MPGELVLMALPSGTSVTMPVDPLRLLRTLSSLQSRSYESMHALIVPGCHTYLLALLISCIGVHVGLQRIHTLVLQAAQCKHCVLQRAAAVGHLPEGTLNSMCLS